MTVRQRSESPERMVLHLLMFIIEHVCGIYLGGMQVEYISGIYYYYSTTPPGQRSLDPAVQRGVPGLGSHQTWYPRFVYCCGRLCTRSRPTDHGSCLLFYFRHPMAASYFWHG